MGKLSLRLLQLIHRNAKSKQPCLVNNLHYASRYTQQDAGFSLLELIAVMVIIGILSAIAAPGWAAFVNRQRVNKANDAVLAALQEAQREAKNKKLSYSVSFRKNSTTQEVAIYSTKKSDGSNLPFAEISTWKPLGADVGANSDRFLLGANLSGENTANTVVPLVSYTLSASTKITFDYMGTLPTANFGTPIAPSTEPPGLKIVVAVPSSTNSTLASSVKRCVIVKTLLGSMITAKDSPSCD
ncbi:prepilin-type N-terminal cleavage/methylation domain-containing protein [Nostoc sp. XA010]|uniref:pilus assembly FimT family protein n=1 Tax=Nostoc sp. XA010 TaxID=2780407 RepID=UPI001E35DF2C|nr:prepilin-type N-terminal cleavage/methylation domain-containing protein [Nostoc sp. XA010]MCC5659721.1 prepilin-type N-terminal cleavage/methylation domain-containing protein [Nostoc sp. XA010]